MPLRTGQVDPKFFQMVNRSEFSGPQVEYLPQGWANENLAAHTTGFATLRGWLESQSCKLHPPRLNSTFTAQDLYAGWWE